MQERNQLKIPNDPMILLSFINMKLRDFYDNFEELCADLDVLPVQIIDKLASIGYEYNEELNKFV
jgi:hypothetical protein